MKKINWQDGFNFLRKLTLRRSANFLQLFSSYFLSKFIKKPHHRGKPFTISIEPTTACNLGCPECPSGLRSFTRSTGNLKKDFFKKVIDEVYKDLVFLIFYFQGEPYINPDFLEMVSYASDRNIYTITSTNGHFLNDENARKTITSGLDRLIISVDGTSQEVYESYRKKGNLEVVLKGASNVVKWKKELKSNKPHLVLQFLVVGPNEHQISDVYKLAEDIGFDEVKLKSAQIYDYKNGHHLIPQNQKYSRYRKIRNGTFEIKNNLLNQCWKMWHSCVITWNGQVVPCCFDKDAEHVLGDLQEEPFSKIWNSSSYNLFRQQLLLGRSNIEICKNCTEGGVLWLEK